MYKSAAEISARRFIGKHATIQTSDKNTHSGFIYVVDPESKSVVLARTNKKEAVGETTGSQALTIITAPSINQIIIDETQDIGEVSIFHTGDQNDYNSQDLQQKKQILKDWLKLNLIDVVDDGESLKFQEHLIIEPPYDLNHCYCTNTVVLDRFRSLIEKMPVIEKI